MNTTVNEIADGIYRISTYVSEVGPDGFTFNQFLLDADEPMLYHTGMKALFPLVSEAIASLVPLNRLRWVAFSHVEADECGAVEQFLAAAPQAQVAHGAIGCMVSLNDMLSRLPRPLADGEVVELGGKQVRARRVRHVDTAHVPHNWESRVLFEEVTRTLLCGDLFTQTGNPPALTSDDIVEQAIAAENVFHFSSLAPAIPATLRQLADLRPVTLTVMHGASYRGDGESALRSLADAYEAEFPVTRLAMDAATPSGPVMV